MSGDASNLELKLVEAWQSQAWWLWLLLPLSWLYGSISFTRRKLYTLGLLKSYRAPKPVMIVGNITVGGSGKTPLIIELVQFLQAKGIKVGVISRGYGGDESLMPCMVTADRLPEEVGDEPYLIVSETGAPMCVSPDRQRAIDCLLTHASDIAFIIADDGLQHYKLQRDIEWIVVDHSRGFGNKQLLPTGFLREPISRLKESTVIYHYSSERACSTHNSIDQPARVNNKADTCRTSLKNSVDTLPSKKPLNSINLTMYLQPSRLISLSGISNRNVYDSVLSKAKYDTADPTLNDQPKKVYALSGIGYPQRFFRTLTDLGFDVIPITKPDHHKFVSNDLIALTDHPIVITSKDAVKIIPLLSQHPELASLSIWVLPVKAVLSESCYTTLMAQLEKLHVI